MSAAADRGLRLSDAAARTLDGLLPGTPDATPALAGYPVGRHAPPRAAVREGFISALGPTMELSLGLVLLGIGLTVLLIPAQPATTPIPRPHMTAPFSGLAPRP